MNRSGRCGSSKSTIAPAPPLPAFTTIVSGASALTVDVGEQVIDVLRLDVEPAHLAAARPRAELAALGERL